MYIIQAINKCIEDDGIYCGTCPDGDDYKVSISKCIDGQKLRIVKNGHMIEIPFNRLKFKCV